MAVKIKRDPSQGIHEDYQTDEHNTSNASIDDKDDSDAVNEYGSHIQEKRGQTTDDCSEDDENYEVEQNVTQNQQNMFLLQSGEDIVFSAIGVVWVTPLSVVRGRLDISNLHLFFYPSPVEYSPTFDSKEGRHPTLV